MPARHRRVGVHGGRRPKTLEGGNRGGSSRRRWCRSMGNLSPLLDLICEFWTGRRLSDQAGAGLGALDGIGAVIWCLVLQVLSAEGRCGRSVGAAGEIATPGGSGIGGWRQGCDGHELSSPIDGIGHSRGWQPGAKVSMIIMRPPQHGQAFHSSCSRPSSAPPPSSLDGAIRYAEKLTCQCDIAGPVGVGKQTVVPVAMSAKIAISIVRNRP